MAGRDPVPIRRATGVSPDLETAPRETCGGATRVRSRLRITAQRADLRGDDALRVMAARRPLSLATEGSDRRSRILVGHLQRGIRGLAVGMTASASSACVLT